MLFSEPKIPQFLDQNNPARRFHVSVLFSEPKIPQCVAQMTDAQLERAGFSALQRAENSSIERSVACPPFDFEFQCSSASRKFLNNIFGFLSFLSFPCFSALQRAENSSMDQFNAAVETLQITFQCSSASRKFLNDARFLQNELVILLRFQCSSASRKFLNRRPRHARRKPPTRFSALQRAENSSIAAAAVLQREHHWFQCSSASRKFLNVTNLYKTLAAL